MKTDRQVVRDTWRAAFKDPRVATIWSSALVTWGVRLLMNAVKDQRAALAEAETAVLEARADLGRLSSSIAGRRRELRELNERYASARAGILLEDAGAEVDPVDPVDVAGEDPKASGGGKTALSEAVGEFWRSR